MTYRSGQCGDTVDDHLLELIVPITGVPDGLAGRHDPVAIVIKGPRALRCAVFIDVNPEARVRITEPTPFKAINAGCDVVCIGNTFASSPDAHSYDMASVVAFNNPHQKGTEGDELQ